MKVNLFQQASREARQRAGRIDQRIESRAGQVRSLTATAEASGRRLGGKNLLSYKKARAAQGTVMFARDQRAGRINANSMDYAREARTKLGPTSNRYTAPVTRLY